MSKTELAHGKDSSQGYQNMRKQRIIPPTSSTCEKLQNDKNVYVANWAICSSYCWLGQCLECRHLSEKFHVLQEALIWCFGRSFSAL